MAIVFPLPVVVGWSWATFSGVCTAAVSVSWQVALTAWSACLRACVAVLGEGSPYGPYPTQSRVRIEQKQKFEDCVLNTNVFPAARRVRGACVYPLPRLSFCIQRTALVRVRKGLFLGRPKKSFTFFAVSGCAMSTLTCVLHPNAPIARSTHTRARVVAVSPLPPRPLSPTTHPRTHALFSVWTQSYVSPSKHKSRDHG